MIEFGGYTDTYGTIRSLAPEFPAMLEGTAFRKASGEIRAVDLQRGSQSLDTSAT